jgi:CubicO group peptidase (beta-lactamase class C family)
MKCRSRNRSRRSAILTIVCFVVFHNSLTLAAQTPTKVNAGKALDEYLTSLERFGFSCQVLVARHGRVLLNKGYGLADVDNQKPVSTHTLYNIASLSKQFTAAAILDLQRRDKLRVSDSISTFLTDVPEDKRVITIQQLLTHTAGVDDDYAGYSRHPYLTKEDFLRSALARPLASKPGETFTYSNDGYTFLAAIIESASGETYESYLRNHLFVPAGLKDTSFVGELGNSAHRLARSYDGLREGGDQARNWSGGLGASDIVSNTSDLFRWYRAIHSTRILNATERSEFFRPHTEKTGIPLAYGYGWWLETTPRGTHAIWHSGHGNGYSSMFRMLVDEDVVIIFLSGFSVADYPLRESLFPTLKSGPLERIVFGMKYVSPPQGMPLSATERRALPGLYRLPDGSHLRVGIWAAGISLTPETQIGFNATLPYPTSGCSEIYDELGIAIPLPSERVAQLSMLTESVRSVLSGLTEHDLRALKKAADEDSQFSGGPPFDIFMDAWTNLERKYGTVESVSVLGTYPLVLTKTVMRSVTFSDVHFHSRTIHFEWRWQDGKLVAPVPDVVQPPLTSFVPTSTTTFSNFSFFMHGVSTIEVLSRSNNIVTRLQLGSGEYSVVATREGTE